MFKMIDVDNSGQITVEELKTGLERVGANLKESEIDSLMQSVSQCWLKYALLSISTHTYISSKSSIELRLSIQLRSY